jgi:hypothetical protein
LVGASRSARATIRSGIASTRIVDRGRDEDGARERLALDRMTIPVKAHFAVYPARHAKRPPVEAFLSWLHGEPRRTPRSRRAESSPSAPGRGAKTCSTPPRRE